MHRYLRAIGFSKLKNKIEENTLTNTVLHDYTSWQEIDITSDTTLIQVGRQIGNGIGLSVIVERDSRDTLTVDHIFPYCLGRTSMSQSDIQIESHSDKEAYSGISDDYNLGITLIYALHNITDYVKSTWSNNYYQIPTRVKLGALSIHGRILCGVRLDSMSFPYEKQPISNKERRNLIAKAKSGDMDALENLTLDDMDTYSLVTKRIKDEDLYTVVETYFMPYGIDNEQYAILGIIRKIEQITNEFSDEIVYNLSILCNDITLQVAINSLDLEGEPQVGRRFKGIIWLQGTVSFSS